MKPKNHVQLSYTEDQLSGEYSQNREWARAGGVTNKRRVQSTGEHGVIEEPVH